MHIPKQPEGTPYTINGYTIEQIKNHCKQIAKQQETVRKHKLEEKGTMFKRREDRNIYDCNSIAEEALKELQ